MLEVLMVAQVIYANQLNDAEKAAWQAYYIQSGMNKRIEERADQLKRLYIPPYVEEKVNVILPIADVMINRRVVWSHEF